MQILVLILMYIFSSLGAAFRGDYSGIENIITAVCIIIWFIVFAMLSDIHAAVGIIFFIATMVAAFRYICNYNK